MARRYQQRHRKVPEEGIRDLENDAVDDDADVRVERSHHGEPVPGAAALRARADERDRKRREEFVRLHFAQLGAIIRGSSGFSRTAAARAVSEMQRRRMKVERSRRPENGDAPSRHRFRSVALQKYPYQLNGRKGVQYVVTLPYLLVEEAGFEDATRIHITVDGGKLILSREE